MSGITNLNNKTKLITNLKTIYENSNNNIYNHNLNDKLLDNNTNIIFDYNSLKTGDLILFNGKKSIISSLIEWYTNSKYSHIGIVLKNPVVYDNNYEIKRLKGLYLLESGAESVPDCVDNVLKYGVQIISLEKKIKNYSGNVYFRKLNTNIDCINSNIFKIYNEIKNKPYDLSFNDLLRTNNINIFNKPKLYEYSLLNWFAFDYHKRDTFYCSSLVAYVYVRLGLLDKSIEWSICNPKFFSSENIDLTLLNESYLETERKIK